MSALDIREAKKALTWWLREWGIDEDPAKKADRFIEDLVTRGWTMDATRETRPQPPRSGTACWTCGKARSIEPPCCDQPARKPERGGDTTTWVDRVRQELHRAPREDA